MFIALKTTGEGGNKKAGQRALPLRKVAWGGAQVAQKPSLILRPGNNQCIKDLRRVGQF